MNRVIITKFSLTGKIPQQEYEPVLDESFVDTYLKVYNTEKMNQFINYMHMSKKTSEYECDESNNNKQCALEQ